MKIINNGFYETISFKPEFEFFYMNTFSDNDFKTLIKWIDYFGIEIKKTDKILLALKTTLESECLVVLDNKLNYKDFIRITDTFILSY